MLITYCLAVILFCAAFYFTKLLTTCTQIIDISHQAIATIADKSRDDDVKEKAAKVAAVSIFRKSFSLSVKIVITLVATVFPLWLADITGMANFSETSEFALRLDVLLVTTIIVSIIVFFGRKLLSRQ